MTKSEINTPIKLYYISPRDVLKARVDPIAIMKTCYALSIKGVVVKLITPYLFRKNNLKKNDLSKAYQIEQNSFSITQIPTVLWDSAPITWVRVNKFICHFGYAFYLLLKLLFSAHNSVIIIYSKCFVGAVPYLFLLKPLKKYLKIKFIFELHTFADNYNHRLVLKNQDGIVCISESLRNIACKTLNYPEEKTTIARHSFEKKDYENKNKNDCRVACNLPVDQFIVTYTGKVYFGMKEIDYILETAKQISDINFLLVGGKEDQVNLFKDKCVKENINNVIFTGFVDLDKVQQYQIASDILILYYPGNWHIKDFLSPGKLIEYMATGNAIISVNFKSIMEVLEDRHNALLIEPDRVSLLVDSICKLRKDEILFSKISSNAKRDSSKYTWDIRAENIISMILSG